MAGGGFLKMVMDTTKEFESPRSFWYWSSLCAISAVLGRKVNINRNVAGILYPNIYVFLYADSGLRKGPPINLAKKLVKRVGNTRVIAGRSSIEGIVKEFQHSKTSPDGSLLKDAYGFIVASEFASSLVESPQALTVLTDLYDGHFNDDWNVYLKNTATQELKNPYVTLLGGINEAHFDGTIPQAAIKGGYIARTFIVHEEEESCVNSLVKAPEVTPNEEELAKELLEISKLKGEFKWTFCAGVEYDKWYKALKKRSKQDKTGTLQRLGDGVLKVAMLLSTSSRKDLLLKMDDIQESIDVCQRVASFVNVATAANGKDDMAEKTARVLKTLIKRKEITRQQLLQANFGAFHALELDVIIQTLEQAGAIKTTMVGKNVVYTIEKKVLDYYEGQQ